MEENKIKEILAKTLGYNMREFSPEYFSIEELEERLRELGLNPKQIIENYEEEEIKKAKEEYRKYFGSDEEDETEDETEDEDEDDFDEEDEDEGYYNERM